MTQKELSYLEDILAFEEQAEKICCDFAQKAQDQQIKDHLNALAMCHKLHITKAYSMLK